MPENVSLAMTLNETGEAIWRLGGASIEYLKWDRVDLGGVSHWKITIQLTRLSLPPVVKDIIDRIVDAEYMEVEYYSA